MRLDVRSRGATVPPRRQSAAIPYRLDEAGVVFVLLVTSRTRKRWILPKGKVGERLLPSRSAEKEAFEEAGVLGRISREAVGSYLQSEHPNGAGSSISISAYPLKVIDELPVWAEMAQRERRWFKIDNAIKIVHDHEIRAILRYFKELFDLVS